MDRPLPEEGPDTCFEVGEPDLPLALERLDGFKFVGLTEEFALSVCLFHAMFGGDCLGVEFTNLRPGNYSDKSSNPFENFSDPYDHPLHSTVSEIFWANIERFGAHGYNCASRICPVARNLFTFDHTAIAIPVREVSPSPFTQKDDS